MPKHDVTLTKKQLEQLAKDAGLVAAAVRLGIYDDRKVAAAADRITKLLSLED